MSFWTEKFNCNCGNSRHWIYSILTNCNCTKGVKFNVNSQSAEILEFSLSEHEIRPEHLKSSITYPCWTNRWHRRSWRAGSEHLLRWSSCGRTFFLSRRRSIHFLFSFSHQTLQHFGHLINLTIINISIFRITWPLDQEAIIIIHLGTCPASRKQQQQQHYYNMLPLETIQLLFGYIASTWSLCNLEVRTFEEEVGN